MKDGYYTIISSRKKNNCHDIHVHDDCKLLTTALYITVKNAFTLKV